MTVSGELAREARELTFEALPPPVVHEAKRRLIDTLGCAIGGCASEDSKIIQDVVRELGSPPEATVVGSGLRTSAGDAALANGVMVRYTEAMDEGYRTSEGVATCGHSGEVIPCIVAVGERQHSTGKEVIAAIVLGYQLMIRFANLVGHHAVADLVKLGWRNDLPTSYIYPLVVGRLLGLDEAQMVNAVGISGAFAGQLCVLDMEGEELTMSRDLACPFPARQAILAALMAKKGFTGPDRVFEGRAGFAEAFTRGKIDLTKLTQRDKDFSILYTGTKSHACNGRLIGAVQATLSLVKEHDIRPEQVAQVSIAGTSRMIEHMSDPARRHPKTKHEADTSTYYTVAAAIIDRALGLDQFTPEKLQDPKVRELSDRVVVSGDPELERFHGPGIVEITTKDGAKYRCRVDIPKGNPANPMSDSELEEKFRSMAAKYMDDAQIREVIATIYNLDKLDDIGQLTENLIFAR